MKTCLSIIKGILLFSVIIYGFAIADTIPAENNWLPRDNDLRILEVRFESYKFEDVIPAYKYEDVVLLPLGILSEIMQLAVTVKQGSAEGFVIREDRTFYLDVARSEIIRQGQVEKYDSSLVHDLGDDIYVESNLLGKWLYMDFNIDLYASILKIKSEHKLPFLQKLEREERIKKTLSRLNNADNYYPRHYEPYKMWSVPFLDQSLTLSRQKNKGEDAFNKYQYTTYASADVLKHEGTVYLSGDEQNELDVFRARLGRKDPEGELLGFMKATEYAVGNITETRVDLINVPGEIEPGFTVSNYAIGRQIEYDRYRFTGILLPGWEVELYRNNALIGYQPAPLDGLYDFQDVSLLFGNNHFRLVFYGPNGQIREEEQYFQLDQSLTKKGRSNYRITATNDKDGGERVTAQYDYGLNKNITTSFNYVDIPLDIPGSREQHHYLKAGARGFWQSFFFDLSAYDDLQSGEALQLNLSSRYGITIFGFKDALLNDFISEEFISGAAAINRRTSASIDTAIPATFLPRMPIRFELTREELNTGDETYELSNTISANVRNFAVSNQLRRLSGTNQLTSTTGSLQLSTNVDVIRIRSILSYELDPESKLTNALISVNPPRIGDYMLNISINHSLDLDLTEYSISANKESDKYNLSFGARYNTDDEFDIGFRLSFGFGYEPRRHDWESNALSVANQGSVSARVFLDQNQDGIFDETDEPIENVGFRLNNGFNGSRTDRDGITFITGIQPYQPLDVVIAQETLDDPLWNTALDGVNVMPRPGNSIVLDFPVFMSGEIDGTVYLRKGDLSFGVGKVEVQLVDVGGRVVQTVETSYDGFYIMSKIPTGEYYLRISQAQIDKLNLKPVNDEFIEISSDNPFQSGFDFTLQSK